MSGVIRFFTSRTRLLTAAPPLRPPVGGGCLPSVVTPPLFSRCSTLMCLRHVSHRARTSFFSSAAAAATTKGTRGPKTKPATALSSPPHKSVAAPSASPPTTPRSKNGRAAKTSVDSSRSNSTSAAASAAAHDEVKVMENDVRLAMRTLMQTHLARRFYTKKKEDYQLEKERDEYREKHEERELRLMRKDENSLRLLGEDGGSLGDGVIPISPSTAHNPYQEAYETSALRHSGRLHGRGALSAAAAAASGGTNVWRALNPVGLVASQAVASITSDDVLSEDDYAAFLASPAASVAGTDSSNSSGDAAELDAWKSTTLATLCSPNLSVYDADHDFRVCSEDVVRQSQTASTAAAAADDQAGKPRKKPAALADSSTLLFPHGDENLEEDTLDADLPATAAAQLKRQFAEEDPDYTVSLYTASDDEDAGPLQL